MPERNRCALCGYYGYRRGFIGYWLDDVDYAICNICWDRVEDVRGSLMAKRKKTTKRSEPQERKEPEIRPCEKCGRIDFKNDYARRAHQGKCASGKPVEVKEPDKASKPKRSRAQVGRSSKAKGSKYENHVKKLLAAWYGEPPQIVGSKASVFQRTPGSGGTSPTNWPLDIHVPEDFPWAVECKNREFKSGGFEAMERFFTASTYALVQWFREAEEELAEAGIQKPLLLIFTRNQFPDFVAFRRPANDKGQHLMFHFHHMTMCAAEFGELIVTTLDNMMTPSLGYWRDAYQHASPQSVMPRRW